MYTAQVLRWSKQARSQRSQGEAPLKILSPKKNSKLPLPWGVLVCIAPIKNYFAPFSILSGYGLRSKYEFKWFESIKGLDLSEVS